MNAKVEYTRSAKPMMLAFVTYASYVVPTIGPYTNEICLWLESSTLVPLHNPSAAIRSECGGGKLDSYNYPVYVLQRGESFKVTIE